MKTRFLQSLPIESQARVARLLARWKPFVAPDLDLRVEGTDMEDGGAAMEPSPEYRMARFHLSLELLARDDDELEEYLVHELSHVFLADPHLFALRVFRTYIKDPDTLSLVESQLQHLVEGATEDITRAFQRLRAADRQPRRRRSAEKDPASAVPEGSP